jgi:hypothetical protein
MSAIGYFYGLVVPRLGIEPRTRGSFLFVDKRHFVLVVFQLVNGFVSTVNGFSFAMNVFI